MSTAGELLTRLKRTAGTRIAPQQGLPIASRDSPFSYSGGEVGLATPGGLARRPAMLAQSLHSFSGSWFPSAALRIASAAAGEVPSLPAPLEQ